MSGKLIVLSDIHANLSALQAVTDDFRRRYRPDGLVLLGDLVNYGMRPNEVIDAIKCLGSEYPIVCNLWGNHEAALVEGGLERFATDRGREVLQYTRSILTPESRRYIEREMDTPSRAEVTIAGRSVLMIHGDIADPRWGKLTPEKTGDERYAPYDYVLAGHTHIPLHTEQLFRRENPAMRNRKRTVFFNPGSVGQPRNHNPRAQYLYLDLLTGEAHHNAVAYDIEAEQALYDGAVSDFYRERLGTGI